MAARDAARFPKKRTQTGIDAHMDEQYMDEQFSIIYNYVNE